MAEPTPPAARFPTTRWSCVLAAGGRSTADAWAALAELCAAYWYPVYALIRRKGHDPDTAADLTQDYFARLLEKKTLAAADPDRGRFRAFLRTDCGFFLADARDREARLKRGGGLAAISIDARDAEGRYHIEPADGLTPERLFDRAWALALLDRALNDVGRHYAATGRAALFERLRPYLTDDAAAPPHEESGRALGMTAGAVQVAVHRVRARFSVALRAQIAATLDAPTPADVDDEVRDLFAALRG
jgi:DNA-directed RNA polymerase specialized sigma24 family protein